MQRIYLTLTLTLGLLLAACATDAERPTIAEEMAERGYLIGPGDQRIPRYRINSWNSVDDSYLIIRSGVRDMYLVELLGPCMDLEGAFFLGFSTPTSRLDRFGDILVQGPGSRSRERCGIRDIFLLNPVE